MSFSHSLHRLQHAADFRQKGMCEERCTVQRSDLRELLNDWARLDAEARDRYSRIMANAGQTLLETTKPRSPLTLSVSSVNTVEVLDYMGTFEMTSCTCLEPDVHPTIVQGHTICKNCGGAT